MVVLGFFSPDDKITEDHFHYNDNEMKVNFYQGSEDELLKYLVEHFSTTGQTVLDMTGLLGKQNLR